MCCRTSLCRWCSCVSVFLYCLCGLIARADVLDDSLVARYNADAADQLLLDTAPGHTVSHDGTGDNVGWVASDSGRNGLLQFTAQSTTTQFTVDPHPDLDSTVGTISFWMNSQGNLGPGNDASMILDRRGGLGDVITLSDTGSLFVQATSGPGSVVNSFSSAITVDDGDWHHVAYVYDQSLDGYTKLFIDGELDIDQPTLDEWFWEPDRQLEFGVSHDVYWKRYDGYLDDVRIYNADLSDDITAIMAETTPQVALDRLVARYDFADGGNALQDTAPSATIPHDGVNAGAIWEDGYQGRSGVMKFVATPSEGSQFVVEPHGDFDEALGAISFWVKTAGNVGPGNYASMLFDRRTNVGDVITLTNDGQIFVQANGGAGVVNSFSTAATIADGQWHHIAYVYNQGIDELTQIYIDGELDSEQAATADWFWDELQQLEFGRSHDTYWRRFDGLMDDVRVYNRLLSAAEVLEIASASSGIPGDHNHNGELDAGDLDLQAMRDCGSWQPGLRPERRWSGRLCGSPTVGQPAEEQLDRGCQFGR